VHSAAHLHRRRLALAISISVVVLIVELVAGIASNSLALVADAGHVFADVSGLALSLGAVWLANRPTSGDRSFGLYRLEILAATANALLLLGISIFVIVEAFQRFNAPPEVDSALVVAVATFALIANLVAIAILAPARRSSLVMRGAFLEVAGDLLGTIAVLAAGAIILMTGFAQADAIASLLIGLLILPRTWALLRDSIDVLLEATPKGVDMSEVRRHILEAPGVVAVHDLHAWTITNGMNVVSAHVVVGPEAAPGDILDHLGMCLAKDFDIDHSTFQLETPEHVIWEGRAAQVQH
jgi:cobalt-zinc-cadmium efflux system protein